MEQLTTAVEWISRHSKHKRANDAVMKLALAATVYHICLEGNSRTLIAKLEASIDSLVPNFCPACESKLQFKNLDAERVLAKINKDLRETLARLEEGPLIRGNYSQTQSGIAP